MTEENEKTSNKRAEEAWQLLVSTNKQSVGKREFMKNYKLVTRLTNGDYTVNADGVETLLTFFSEKYIKFDENVKKALKKIREEESRLIQSEFAYGKFEASLRLLNNDAQHTISSLEKLLERYEQIKRLPSKETASTHIQNDHFTCTLCGCSMGKIKRNFNTEWEWALPNYYPNCGAEVRKPAKEEEVTI